MILFGIVAVVSGSLIVLLPETFQKSLPDHIEDAVAMGRKDEEEGDE